MIVIGTVGVLDFYYFQEHREKDFQRLQTPASITDPHFYLADDPVLDSYDASARVIGVVDSGIAKAYLVDALVYQAGASPLGPGVHVVNDVVGSQGICVSYCDMKDCVRVLAKNNAKTIVKVVGFKPAGMVLESGQSQFIQSKDEIEGFTNFEFEDMSWGEWRKNHPQSMLYVGKIKSADTEQDDTLTEKEEGVDAK